MTRFWITLQQGVDLVLKSFVDMRGAEIFVPKIPSMRVVDLAKAMAPHLEQRIIGIRPGEKLHEVMITSDDARSTYDLGDCYVIEPSFSFFNRRRWQEDGAKAVPARFAYASDTNDEWLTTQDLHDMLGFEAADATA